MGNFSFRKFDYDKAEDDLYWAGDPDPDSIRFQTTEHGIREHLREQGLDPDKYFPKDEEETQGCYIATAVYGSYDCPPVWTLRRFRDFRLAKTLPGKAFIRLYYATSPALVRRFGSKTWLRKIIRARLDRLVRKLQAEGFSSEPYQDKTW